MHLRTILAIARKDTIDILLNRTTLVILAMPILLALFFLMIGRLIGTHNTNFLVYNPGQSPIVQILSEDFDQVHITEAGSPGEVTAAFGPNGTSKESPYDLGLIVPADFESALRAGNHPQVSLYLNGNTLDNHNSLALQAAITSYARQVAAPQPPLLLSTAMINPPPATNVGAFLDTYYGAVALLMSLMVGTSLMPGLLIEEKERKTLRMLMVTPASFTDVVLGKLLVALLYQVLLSIIAIVIDNGLTGQIPLVFVYLLLGSCLSVALGLLLGCLFQTASTAGALGGILMFIYIAPAVFTGPLSTLLDGNALVQFVKVLPTYYLADGAYNAMQGQGTLSGHLLDISVVLGVTLALIALSAWVLRRQSAVTATI